MSPWTRELVKGEIGRACGRSRRRALRCAAGRAAGEGGSGGGRRPKPAPGSLALVQGFVNTRNIMRGYGLLEDVEGAVAWLVEHGLLDGGVRLTGWELGHLIGFREGLRGL